jgi:trehalose 6-phosphate phosphatase
VQVLTQLSQKFFVAIVTGRKISTIIDFVGLDRIYYAGSHGFDIRGPGNILLKEVAAEYLPALRACSSAIRASIEYIPGASIEDNTYSFSVHYRNIPADFYSQTEHLVTEACLIFPSLIKRSGKMVWEITPNINWHKGKAVDWLLHAVFADPTNVIPIYLGDDVADESVFNHFNEGKFQSSIGICVMSHNRQTAARYALRDPAQVLQFLQLLNSVGSPCADSISEVS